MKKVLIALLVITLLPFQASADSPWIDVSKRVLKSVVSIQTPTGRIYCTGFVIDNDRDHVMSAQHCSDNGPMVVDGIAATILYANADLDLAVLHVPGIDRPALRMGRQTVIGQEIAAVGYGLGLHSGGLYADQALFRPGHVSGMDVVFPPGSQSANTFGKWLTTNALIPGMSGGPMVDLNGRVVSINLLSNDVLGFGRSIRDIRIATFQYWRT